MTREQEFLLTVLQSAVRGEAVHTVPKTDFQWDVFLSEAKAHAVLLIVFETLQPILAQIPLDPGIIDLYTASVLSANISVEQAQAELVRVLEQVDCPYVIMKGLSAAAWYPKPQLRQLGDVDFIVPPERTEQIAELMKQRGYVHKCVTGLHHQNLDKDGASLEMHIEIAGMPVGEDAVKVQQLLSSIYERRQRLETDIDSFYVPSDLHQALIQLLHIQNHILSGGIGLRHVMDWGCLVNGTAHKPFWEKQMLPLMRKIGLFHFTAVITKVVSRYLGSVCPDWAKYVDDALCADFMEDVLAGGNFGSKDTRRNHCFGLFPDWKRQDLSEGKVKRLYKSLRRVVWEQYPHVQGKPFRTLVLMMYKAARYVGLFLIGKRPDLGEVAVLAAERETVYNRLRMFEKGDQRDS